MIVGCIPFYLAFYSYLARKTTNYYYYYYRADNNCQKYFLCIGSKPRVLFCGSNTAYDELTNTCVSADEVAACPQELRAQAARVREEEKQLLAKELEFNAKTTNKRRYQYN